METEPRSLFYSFCISRQVEMCCARCRPLCFACHHPLLVLPSAGQVVGLQGECVQGERCVGKPWQRQEAKLLLEGSAPHWDAVACWVRV